MTTFPHRVIRMCIFQQLVYIHQIQDLLLTTKATTKAQSTYQLFLEINHVVSASDQLMPSYSQLSKSTTTSHNNVAGEKEKENPRTRVDTRQQPHDSNTRQERNDLPTHNPVQQQ